MSRDNFGFALVVGILAMGALIAYLLVYVWQIDWFRERLLSDDRGTRIAGMLPIMGPLSLIAAVIFAATKGSS